MENKNKKELLESPESTQNLEGKENFESPEDQKLSKEEQEEIQLDNLYKGLSDQENKLERLGKDQENIKRIEEELGVNSSSPKENGETSTKVEVMKNKVLEAEKAFMGIPESNENAKQEKAEEFQNSEEFKKLQKEMDEEAKEARKKYLEKTSDKIMEKFSNEFSRAENGKKAEKVFRKKFAIYFNKALESTDKDVTTFMVFHFMTLKNPDGKDVFYVENIEMENKSTNSSEKPISKEKNDGDQSENKEEKLELDSSVDPKLMGKKEEKELHELEQKGFTK